MAAGSARDRADGESCRRCLAWSSDGYSLQARCLDDCPLRGSCAMANSSQGRYSADCSSRARSRDGYLSQASCPDDCSSQERCALAYSVRQSAGSSHPLQNDSRHCLSLRYPRARQPNPCCLPCEPARGKRLAPAPSAQPRRDSALRPAVWRRLISRSQRREHYAVSA
jgi:hypothetical protein